MHKILGLIVTSFILTLILSATATPQDFNDNDFSHKLTPEARASLDNLYSAQTDIFWIFLDTTQVSFESVPLTDKARRRRAKVDPDNYLRDNRDYRINPQILSFIEQSGAKIRRVSRWFKAVSVEADRFSMGQLLSQPQVKKVSRVGVFRREIPPTSDKPQYETKTDASAELPYGYSLFQNRFVNAVKLHRANLSGKGIMIAVFDTGFNINHRCFENLNIISTYDFINNDTDVTGVDCPDDIVTFQQDSHGTSVLSVIGSYLPDTLIGVAYDADFILAKTEISCYNVELKIEEDNWIAAAEWADSIGTDIISSSLGYYIFDDSGSYSRSQLDGNTALITQAADIAASKNILVVTAAGNERQRDWGTIIFPADGDSVVAVGAVREDSILAAFSSPGPTADGRIKPDIVTLGSGVLAARSSAETFTYFNGTSAATPLVAGSAALAFEFDSTMTAMEYFDLMRQTGSKASNPNNNYGYGLLDASKAADILRFDVNHDVSARLGETLSLPISVSTRGDYIPIIGLANSLPGVSISDNSDGTAVLSITANRANLGLRNILISAEVSGFVDSTIVTVYTRSLSATDGNIYAGPNPFTDLVTFYLESASGQFKSVSIYNMAGEKVWETVNISSTLADVTIIEWTGYNQRGDQVVPGVYIAVIETDLMSKKIKLLKL